MTSEVHRAGERFRTQIDWLTRDASFSFGHHYDPGNTHHGLLVAHNDDLLQPGGGFAPHKHRDVEIVSWVLSGTLRHDDQVLAPGTVQRLSAGSGVNHSEVNAGAGPLRFVQMWVVPSERGTAPSYEAAAVDLPPGELVALASGNQSAAVRLGQRAATLWAVRLRPGDAVDVPAAGWLHVFVASGSTEDLREGDALRLKGSGVRLRARDDAEVLVWSMERDLVD